MTDIEDMLRDIRWEVEMTRRHIGKNALDEQVMAAMARVPRASFIPEEMRPLAFRDGPVPIGHGQTISQPYIVALMTDLLAPEPSDIILELGTGSGYQAAILSQLVKQIYSIEIIPALANAAAERLHSMGYANVEVRQGDGYAGLPEHAPYDGIIVTAATPHIPPALIEQLKLDACLVIPVGHAGWTQMLKVIRKMPDGQLHEQDILAVSFVPLTGEHLYPEAPPRQH